jgi:serine/threonine-protein kinase
LFYAYPTWTAAEARDAVGVLSHYLPLPNHAMDPSAQGALGRVYFLAGQAERAIPLLRAEASWCVNPPMQGFEPGGVVWHLARLRDFWFLGQALEQQGDTEGACRAYGAVLDRWGRATPRSLTADNARARASALRCKR